MLSNTLKLNFGHLKIIRIFHPHYQLRIIGHIPKNKQKNKCVCIHETIWLIIMKMKIKRKKRSRWYNINRPSSTHGYRYSKYWKCLSMMMLISGWLPTFNFKNPAFIPIFILFHIFSYCPQKYTIFQPR